MRGNLSSRARLLTAGALAAIAILVTPVGSVAAVPASPQFGPVIEDYAEYEGQTKCKPNPKPGVVAFEQMLLQTYPQVTYTNITRRCKDGGQSEHKEGRALDWAADVSDPAQRAAAQELLDWLTAPDAYGNPHAMLRRLGIIYVIWNRRMWSSWDQTWEPYCVQKRKVCRDPDSKAVVHPHTDHVHFSFGWPGARKMTSYWNPQLSQLPPVPVIP